MWISVLKGPTKGTLVIVLGTLYINIVCSVLSELIWIWVLVIYANLLYVLVSNLPQYNRSTWMNIEAEWLHLFNSILFSILLLQLCPHGNNIMFHLTLISFCLDFDTQEILIAAAKCKYCEGP